MGLQRNALNLMHSSGFNNEKTRGEMNKLLSKQLSPNFTMKTKSQGRLRKIEEQPKFQKTARNFSRGELKPIKSTTAQSATRISNNSIQ